MFVGGILSITDYYVFEHICIFIYYRDFILQIRKVPIPYCLGKFLMPKANT